MSVLPSGMRWRRKTEIVKYAHTRPHERPARYDADDLRRVTAARFITIPAAHAWRAATVRLYGDDTAVVTGIQDQVTKVTGHDTSGKFRVVVVTVKPNSRWLSRTSSSAGRFAPQATCRNSPGSKAEPGTGPPPLFFTAGDAVSAWLLR